jgi:hypothetical protein
MDHTPGRSWRLRRTAAVIAAAAGVTLFAHFEWQGKPVPEETTPVGTDGHTTPADRARQQQPATKLFDVLEDAGPEPNAQIELTEQQELIIDSALLSVMNFYLIERHDAQRASALSAYLKKKLPSSAAREAEQIAVNYQAYIAAHDQLLLTQNFNPAGAAASPPDLTRLSNWQQQRARLRANMLGERVAQAWYDNDEAILTQALDELRHSQESGGMPAVADNSVNNTASTADDQARHNWHMREVLNRAVASYSVAARGSR